MIFDITELKKMKLLYSVTTYYIENYIVVSNDIKKMLNMVLHEVLIHL